MTASRTSKRGTTVKKTNEKQRGERGKVSFNMNPNQEPYEPKQFQSIKIVIISLCLHNILLHTNYYPSVK